MALTRPLFLHVKQISMQGRQGKLGVFLLFKDTTFSHGHFYTCFPVLFSTLQFSGNIPAVKTPRHEEKQFEVSGGNPT